MNVQATSVAGEQSPVPTTRSALAKVVVNRKSEKPYEVISIRTKSRLAAFTQREHAESFIANVAISVLQECQ